jgi:hypothetical protein
MSSYLPPPPPSPLLEPPAIVEAREQCMGADWGYIGAATGAFALTTAVDLAYLKPSESFALRATGPALIGASVGWLLSAAAYARPLCDDGLRLPPAPEGAERDVPEIAWLAPLLGLILAPTAVAVAEGRVPPEWPFSERWQRLTGAAIAGVAGTYMHELWQPRPLRGIRTLDRASLELTGAGASFTLSF